MCGLFGALSFNDNPINSNHAQSMSARVAQRGPDDSGEFFDGPVMLGHRRLAIIDLSPAGHQPMHDCSKRYSIVFNGTIYNYPALREILIGKGFKFNSHSDTEVIINAYACWGEACVEQLHGMFAFAIWDSRQRKLFLARDRMGIKPLYYAVVGAGILLRIESTGAACHRFVRHRYRCRWPAPSIEPARGDSGAAYAHQVDKKMSPRLPYDGNS